jgi:hypothetical protein
MMREKLGQQIPLNSENLKGFVQNSHLEMVYRENVRLFLKIKDW